MTRRVCCTSNDTSARRQLQAHLLAIALRLELIQLGLQARCGFVRLRLHVGAQCVALLLVLMAQLPDDRQLLAVDVLQLLRYKNIVTHGPNAQPRDMHVLAFVTCFGSFG